MIHNIKMCALPISNIIVGFIIEYIRRIRWVVFFSLSRCNSGWRRFLCRDFFGGHYFEVEFIAKFDEVIAHWSRFLCVLIAQVLFTLKK